MKITRLSLGALALMLAACGGSSDSGGNSQPPPVGQQPTPVTVAGKVTGFGSIYVNGIEFETNSATYDLDDTTGSSDSDISVGMYVVVEGSLNADGVSGTADSVYYEDEVEGPVEGLTTDVDDSTIKTFTVLNVAVRVDSSTVFSSDDGTPYDFDAITDGDVVEVSGDYIGDLLHATYVELQDDMDNEYEVEGTISGFNGTDVFTLSLANGATLNVTLAPAAEIPSGGIVDGQYVEVEGTIPDPVGFPDDLLAMKVELEDDDYFDEDDNEVEIKGPLSYDEGNGSWSVNGTLIVFGASTEYKPATLADAIADGSAHGLYVEVEGRYVDGALQADEIEIEEDDLEFKAYASAINATDAKNGTLTLSFGGASGTVQVIVNGGTLYMDDNAVTPFDLTTLPLGTKVEIHARRNDAGNIVASTLEIEDGMGVEIEGPVSGADETSISILGVVFAIGANTIVEGGLPMDGDYAEIEDENEDGTADVVEIDD
jgi:hypothetical protein